MSSPNISEPSKAGGSTREEPSPASKEPSTKKTDATAESAKKPEGLITMSNVEWFAESSNEKHLPAEAQAQANSEMDALCAEFAHMRADLEVVNSLSQELLAAANAEIADSAQAKKDIITYRCLAASKAAEAQAQADSKIEALRAEFAHIRADLEAVNSLSQEKLAAANAKIADLENANAKAKIDLDTAKMDVDYLRLAKAQALNN